MVNDAFFELEDTLEKINRTVSSLLGIFVLGIFACVVYEDETHRAGNNVVRVDHAQRLQRVALYHFELHIFSF